MRFQPALQAGDYLGMPDDIVERRIGIADDLPAGVQIGPGQQPDEFPVLPGDTHIVPVMVGDPEKDKALLTAGSPALNADKIRSPLLIAQGARGPRVNKDESDQMVAALKARGIDVPYIVKDNEGHGFRNEENQFAFYEAMETFLGKYLGGRKAD